MGWVALGAFGAWKKDGFDGLMDFLGMLEELMNTCGIYMHL